MGIALRRLKNFVPRWGRRAVRRSGWRVPIVLTIGISLGLTIGLFAFMRCWERGENQAEFDYASRHFVEAIRRATERIELTHEFMRQDYYGSPNVSREEFSLCCEPILAHVPSLKVLQWALRVGRDQRDEFELTARREGWPNYRIIEPDPRGQLIPAKQRAAYFPIWYAASKCGFRARFGWDFAADPVLCKAIDKSRDADQFVVSDPIDLSKVGIQPRMMQTFMPLYRDFQAVHTVADRRTHLDGFLVGLCQIDDLVDCAIDYANGPQGIDLALFDESAPADPRLLYFHGSRTRGEKDHGPASQAKMRPTGIHHTEPLVFGGRRWAVVCTPAPQFFASHESWRSWTILLIGLMASGLAGAYTWAATTRTERIERLVDERTAQLRKKDDQLRQSQELKAQAIRVAHEETIHRLVTASLCRDEETGMHIKRTGLLSELLARAAGWSESDAEIIRLAAPMHDVGKIGIPDAVLRKPGKLTPAEFDIMKTHTRIGARMLEGSQSAILVMARDIALCHHEYWDGAGYPQGLSGLAIPEPARILSIVDVYDALSHDRVYRPALPEDEVLDYMVRRAGTQFDPALLAVFLANYEAVRRIAQENPDEAATNFDVSSLLAATPLSPPMLSPELDAGAAVASANHA